MPTRLARLAATHSTFHRGAASTSGAHIERTSGGKLAVRHECGALNAIAPNGKTEDGSELWKVVGEVETAHYFRVGVEPI